MASVRWDRYPLLASTPRARAWLQIQANLDLAPNTVEAYGRALEDYIAFTASRRVDAVHAGREHVSAYVRDLCTRPNRNGANLRSLDSGAGLANATMQLRLTAVRLFYDYLIEEGQRTTNPVGRGRYTPGKGFGGVRDRGLIPRYRKLPWIPSDDQWRDVLEAARHEPIRDRLMLALAYDAGLRREELCALEVGDIDPSGRWLRIRAETTKGRAERRVQYSEPTGELYAAYLRHRQTLSREPGPLFLSESNRNRGGPITIWTWSKAVERMADHAGLPRFTTHTPRHLCLTDLARADWDIHEIATFAGHRSIQTTLQYIHLSGGELAAKLARGMDEIHAWRVKMTGEALL